MHTGSKFLGPGVYQAMTKSRPWFTRISLLCASALARFIAAILALGNQALQSLRLERPQSYVTQFQSGRRTGPKVRNEPFKTPLVQIMILPTGEVRNVVFPYLTRCIFSDVSVKTVPLSNPLKWYQGDREQYLAMLAKFSLSCLGDLCRDPLTAHTVVGKDHQQTIMDPYRLINLVMELDATS